MVPDVYAVLPKNLMVEMLINGAVSALHHALSEALRDVELSGVSFLWGRTGTTPSGPGAVQHGYCGR